MVPYRYRPFAMALIGAVCLAAAAGPASALLPQPSDVRPASTDAAAISTAPWTTPTVSVLRVKLAPGTLQVHGRRLVPAGAADSASLLRTPAHTLAAVIEESTSAATPVFAQRSPQLATWRRAAPTLPDLSQWFDLTPRPGVTVGELQRTLLALPGVLHAYVPPTARPQAILGTDPVQPLSVPHRATPDFSDQQGYRKGGDGIDALYANSLPGGAGQGIRVHSLEMGWLRNHEDLTTLARPEALVQFSEKPDFAAVDHGTATVGIDVGTQDAKGITGIAYAAEGQITNILHDKWYTNIGGAITTALTALRPGDVISIQIAVHGCDNSVPGGADAFVEYEPATYDAIRTAVAQGVHFVQSGGNGQQNYDHPCYADAMPPKLADSGSIVVGGGGAGTAQGPKCHDARTPLKFTNYGQRIDLQGWGECVTTAGYGDLQGGDVNQRYTAQFGGTSAAAPIVAGAIATLSGIAKARGKQVTPAAMRELLIRTGTPQPEGDVRRIGPAPNLKAAIDALPSVWNDATP